MSDNFHNFPIPDCKECNCGEFTDYLQRALVYGSETAIGEWTARVTFTAVCNDGLYGIPVTRTATIVSRYGFADAVIAAWSQARTEALAALTCQVGPCTDCVGSDAGLTRSCQTFIAQCAPELGGETVTVERCVTVVGTDAAARLLADQLALAAAWNEACAALRCGPNGDCRGCQCQEGGSAVRGSLINLVTPEMISAAGGGLSGPGGGDGFGQGANKKPSRKESTKDQDPVNQANPLQPVATLPVIPAFTWRYSTTVNSATVAEGGALTITIRRSPVFASTPTAEATAYALLQVSSCKAEMRHADPAIFGGANAMISGIAKPINALFYVPFIASSTSVTFTVNVGTNPAYYAGTHEVKVYAQQNNPTSLQLVGSFTVTDAGAKPDIALTVPASGNHWTAQITLTRTVNTAGALAVQLFVVATSVDVNFADGEASKVLNVRDLVAAPSCAAGGYTTSFGIAATTRYTVSAAGGDMSVTVTVPSVALAASSYSWPASIVSTQNATVNVTGSHGGLSIPWTVKNESNVVVQSGTLVIPAGTGSGVIGVTVGPLVTSVDWTLTIAAPSSGCGSLGSPATATLHLLADATAPVCTITSPAASSSTTGATQVVAITATDDTAIDYVNVYVNGSLAGTATHLGGSSYQFTASLVSGVNTIYARAFDTLANQGDSTTITVIRTSSAGVIYVVNNSADTITTKWGTSGQASLALACANGSYQGISIGPGQVASVYSAAGPTTWGLFGIWRLASTGLTDYSFCTPAQAARWTVLGTVNQCGGCPAATTPSVQGSASPDVWCIFNG